MLFHALYFWQIKITIREEHTHTSNNTQCWSYLHVVRRLNFIISTWHTWTYIEHHSISNLAVRHTAPGTTIISWSRLWQLIKNPFFSRVFFFSSHPPSTDKEVPSIPWEPNARPPRGGELFHSHLFCCCRPGPAVWIDPYSRVGYLYLA